MSNTVQGNPQANIAHNAIPGYARLSGVTTQFMSAINRTASGAGNAITSIPNPLRHLSTPVKIATGAAAITYLTGNAIMLGLSVATNNSLASQPKLGTDLQVKLNNIGGKYPNLPAQLTESSSYQTNHPATAADYIAKIVTPDIAFVSIPVTENQSNTAPASSGAGSSSPSMGQSGDASGKIQRRQSGASTGAISAGSSNSTTLASHFGEQAAFDIISEVLNQRVSDTVSSPSNDGSAALKMASLPSDAASSLCDLISNDAITAAPTPASAGGSAIQKNSTETSETKNPASIRRRQSNVMGSPGNSGEGASGMTASAITCEGNLAAALTPFVPDMILRAKDDTKNQLNATVFSEVADHVNTLRNSIGLLAQDTNNLGAPQNSLPAIENSGMSNRLIAQPSFVQTDKKGPKLAYQDGAVGTASIMTGMLALATLTIAHSTTKRPVRRNDAENNGQNGANSTEMQNFSAPAYESANASGAAAQIAEPNVNLRTAGGDHANDQDLHWVTQGMDAANHHSIDTNPPPQIDSTTPPQRSVELYQQGFSNVLKQRAHARMTETDEYVRNAESKPVIRSYLAAKDLASRSRYNPTDMGTVDVLPWFTRGVEAARQGTDHTIPPQPSGIPATLQLAVVFQQGAEHYRSNEATLPQVRNNQTVEDPVTHV